MSIVMTLLQRSLFDEDDETRDRAAIAVATLEDAMIKYPYQPPTEDDDNANDPIVVDSSANGDISHHGNTMDRPEADDPAAYVLLESLPMNFDKLERSLKVYMQHSMYTSPDPITVQTLPVVEDAPASSNAGPSANKNTMVDDDMDDMNGTTSNGDDTKKDTMIDPAALVYAIPELAHLGRAFRSSIPVPLTESETEYVVNCTKHIFTNHVVLQFSVQNTIDNQRLDNVTVLVDDSDSEIFSASGEIACGGVLYGETKHCFTILERNTEVPLASNTFACELRFTVMTVDPMSGEEEGDTFEEEYPLENLEITTADFMAKVAVPDFRKAWEATGNDKDNEVVEKFFLGMQPCDGTASIKPTTGPGKPHLLHLSGVFVAGQQVLARAQIAMQGENSSTVILKIAVRSSDAIVSRMVADCIR
jgi:coatomer subunit gamma